MAMLAPLSPRVMGEAAYAAGRTAGTGQRIAAPTAKQLADLYSRYPTGSLITSRASDYAGVIDPDQLKQRYGLDAEGF